MPATFVWCSPFLEMPAKLVPYPITNCIFVTHACTASPSCKQVVALATELVKWYRAHENSTWHIVDPDIAATCANGAGMRVDCEIEGESSDGEGEDG